MKYFSFAPLPPLQTFPSSDYNTHRAIS
jgi:hypothetical protein